MSEEEHVQQAQLARHEQWIREEGRHDELPVLDSTYERPHEQARLKWHRENTLDVPTYPHTCFKSIIEFGCSTGRILTECNGLMGIDRSAAIIKSNQMIDSKRVWMQADVTANTFKELRGNFHTVLLPGFLEHLQYWQALEVIRKAKRIATHRVLLTVPNGTDPAKNVQDATNFKHCWILTKVKLKEIVKVCAEDGWTVKPKLDENTVFLRLDKK